MAVSIIEATSPEIVPASSSRTLDKYYIDSLVFDGSAFPSLRMSIEVKKFGVDQDGFHLSKATPIVLSFDDLFALSETDADVLAMLNAVNKVVENKLNELELR